MHRAMSSAFETAPVSYNTRDLLTYAIGIGCGPNEPYFTYGHHSSFSAFPAYPVVLQFKGTDHESRRAAQAAARRLFARPLPWDGPLHTKCDVTVPAPDGEHSTGAIGLGKLPSLTCNQTQTFDIRARRIRSFLDSSW